MGGRGASSAGGGSAKGELTLPNGSKIEFEGTLHYGGNDKALGGTARANIESWEKKRAQNKIEYAYTVDENGNPVGREIRGGKGSVSAPTSYHNTPNGTFTHNHPRGDGMLGGTFSTADVFAFANHKNRTMRAAAKEGTYSMSKTGKFDASGFKAYAKKCDAAFQSFYKGETNKVYKEYRDGRITYDEYKKANAKAFNTALVKLHSDYRAGQKQYGYTYTLEKNS